MCHSDNAFCMKFAYNCAKNSKFAKTSFTGGNLKQNQESGQKNE